MPLLTVTTTADPSADARDAVADALTEAYADVMDTTTGHVAVVFERVDDADMHLGREEPGDRCFLEADVRRGRDEERRRTYALAAMDVLAERFDVPTANLKVVFTQHPGVELMGYERVGSEWSADETE